MTITRERSHLGQGLTSGGARGPWGRTSTWLEVPVSLGTTQRSRLEPSSICRLGLTVIPEHSQLIIATADMCSNRRAHKSRHVFRRGWLKSVTQKRRNFNPRSKLEARYLKRLHAEDLPRTEDTPDAVFLGIYL